jgi:hypothetical protein
VDLTGSGSDSPERLACSQSLSRSSATNSPRGLLTSGRAERNAMAARMASASSSVGTKDRGLRWRRSLSMYRLA